MKWYRLMILLCLCICLIFTIVCTPIKHQTILIHMMPAQEDYFKQSIIKPYETQTVCSVTVVTYHSTDSIEQALLHSKDPVSVVKVPFDKAMPLLKKDRFTVLDSFLSQREVQQFKDDYLMTSIGAKNGKCCLIPRKFETRLMVYRKSKVESALASWHEHEFSIDSVLKEYNGFGLPANYTLESDLEQWDYYDMFVVGYVWGHTAYDGVIKPRMGFRGKHYSGTTQRIYDRIYQLGGDSSSIIHMKGDAVVDAFYWEALYTAAGIYNNRMWKDGWSGADIWKAFQSSDVFLSFMTQLDCFFIHGTGSNKLHGFLGDPGDMGVTTMPNACSFHVNNRGVPLRKGTKAISTGGWWWGIPREAPDPRGAFNLISYITGTKVQIQEATRFGMIPVRKDILGDMALMFGGGWIYEIYEVSFRQMVINGYTVLPSHEYFNEINALYLDCVEDILVSGKWSESGEFPDKTYITSKIQAEYQPKLHAYTKF